MRVACIGLGLLGSRLAERVADAGHDVCGFDVLSVRDVPGVRSAGSVADAVADAEIVLLSLPTSRDGIEVTLGPDGVCEHAGGGTLVVDTTTADPADSVHMAARLSPSGIRFIDATVSGNPPMAQRRELTVMAGGSEADVERAGPVLDSFARVVYRVGPVGSGARMKLIINHALGIHRTALAETLVTAEQAGLDLGLVLQILRESAAASKAMDLWGERMVQGDHETPTSLLRQTLKDARLIVAQADALGVSSDLAKAVLMILEEGIATGLAEADNSAVMEVLRRRARSSDGD